PAAPSYPDSVILKTSDANADRAMSPDTTWDSRKSAKRGWEQISLFAHFRSASPGRTRDGNVPYLTDLRGICADARESVFSLPGFAYWIGALARYKHAANNGCAP